MDTQTDKQMNKLVYAALAGVVLLAVAIGGYFLYQKIANIHAENADQLADFGVKVIPVRQGGDAITIGEGGQVQVPPSIIEKPLSPSEKVIVALSQEKAQLMGELAFAKERVQELEAELTLLKDYRQENERYAPLPMRAERARALQNLRKSLHDSPDASRFDAFQIDAMALAAANIYREMLIKYRLTFSEEQKDQIIRDHLPAYGFCIGDGLGFVANDGAERRMLLDYLESGDQGPLARELKEDLRTITQPCIQSLNQRVNQLLNEG